MRPTVDHCYVPLSSSDLSSDRDVYVSDDISRVLTPENIASRSVDTIQARIALMLSEFYDLRNHQPADLVDRKEFRRRLSEAYSRMRTLIPRPEP